MDFLALRKETLITIAKLVLEVIYDRFRIVETVFPANSFVSLFDVIILKWSHREEEDMRHEGEFVNNVIKSFKVFKA